VATLRRAISVFVVDDHQLVREGLVQLLRVHGAFVVAGEAGHGAQAIERIPALDPDVAVVDLVMPVMGGIETTRWIREHHPRTEVVAISALHAETYQREAFEAGARGYVVKEAAFEQLADAVRSAAHGDYYLAGAAGHDVVAEYANPWVARQKPGGLITPRERELAVLLADGYSSKEAAAILSISVRTADTHRASLMRKLDARNVADVVKYCIRNGLISV
jgi:DNA-binding NarL/FixJ family response regulator